MALRAWLKKEELFDTEIENVLAELNVEGEESLVALSSKDLSEFERKVKVARAQDLKDQTAKVRLEKKLNKLRKIWTTGNGKDTSSKVASATSPKSGVDENDEKSMGGHGGNVSAQANNEALAKARGLKAWMQKESSYIHFYSIYLFVFVLFCFHFVSVFICIYMLFICCILFVFCSYLFLFCFYLCILYILRFCDCIFFSVSVKNANILFVCFKVI